MNSNRILVFCIAVLALLGFSLAFFSDESGSLNTFRKADLNFNSRCLYEGSTCSLHLADNLELHLESTPSEIRALERFQLSMTVPSKGHDISDLVIWAEGRDMEMGKHFLQLPETDFDLNSGIIVSGVIPVCTVDEQMIWRLVISFMHQGKLINVNLDLKTLNH